MSTLSYPDVSAWRGAFLLQHLSCLQAEGADAASFLHGQLSQDVQSLPPNEARPAAFCSPKGRMLADMLLLRPTEERVLMVLGGDVAPSTLKRLSMFVLRAKARLADASAQLSLVGLLGPDVPPLPAPAQGQALPVISETVQGQPAWVIRLPDVLGLARAIWVGPAELAPTRVSTSPPSAPDGAWGWLEVMSGVPRISAATVDQFVPQMVNFELIGGVNFRKGCYPGQEIVARSQYRGTLKRRLFLAHAQSPMEPGQEVFAADDPGQPAGQVVNAAPMPGGSGSWSALIELKLQWTDSALALGSPSGPALALGQMPYDVVALDL